MGRNRRQISEGPQMPECFRKMLFTNCIHRTQGGDSNDRIGETRGEFHRNPGLICKGREKQKTERLQPNKQGRFFPKRQKVNLHTDIIPGNNHFPCRLSKINFVPIKQMGSTQKRNVYKCTHQRPKQIRSMLQDFDHGYGM